MNSLPSSSTSPPATVGILAGMGPAAGVDFARLFLEAATDWLRSRGRVVEDQAYPEHWIAQVPVADRTGALLDPTAPQPLEAMVRALRQLEGLGACAVAMACNTAHAWHGALQERVPGVELLHIAEETARDLCGRGVERAALLATQGTYRMNLYERAFEAQGVQCQRPDSQAQGWLMEGIYDGVKAGDMALARERFVRAGQQVRAQQGEDVALVMACTEIPLALSAAPEAATWTLVDPSRSLAAALVRKAYG